LSLYRFRQLRNQQPRNQWWKKWRMYGLRRAGLA
jgi:hypothetical protein